MYIKKITQLIPTPEFPVYTGDMERIKALERKLKVNLPEDYYNLIKAYGAGYFGGYFIIYNPFIEEGPVSLTFALNENKYYYECAKESWNMELPGVNIKCSDALMELFESKRNADGSVDYSGDKFNNIGYPFSFFPEKGGLFPCAEYNGEYTIYWKTGGEKWTIVVYNDDYYSEFDMTLTEFLYKLIIGEISMNSLREVFALKGLIFEQYVEQ